VHHLAPHPDRGLYSSTGQAFLVSYDANVDPDNAGLSAILAANGAICAEISLQSHSSLVNNDREECGTKLPRNATTVIGVMDGKLATCAPDCPGISDFPEEVLSVENGFTCSAYTAPTTLDCL
jgi:hypothetical protein